MAKKTPSEKLAKILEQEEAQEQTQGKEIKENDQDQTVATPAAPVEEKLVETEIKLSENPEIAEIMKAEGMLSEEEIAQDVATIQYNEAETTEEAILEEKAEQEKPAAPKEVTQEEALESLKVPHGELDGLLSEIAEMQKEEVEASEEIVQEYQMAISEENLPPVILEGEAYYVVDGKYMPEIPALIEFQKRKILREFKKYKQLLAKLKK